MGVLCSVRPAGLNCQLSCTFFAVSDEAPNARRLGRELSSARLSAKRSLRDVAGESDISAAYLQKLERGRVEGPSPKVLRRLATVLGIEYQRLMELVGYDVPRSRPADPLATRFADARLTEVEERAVAAFIDHLLASRES